MNRTQKKCLKINLWITAISNVWEEHQNEEGQQTK
jgi:hypothetical protein